MKKLSLLLLTLTICFFTACHDDIWNAIDDLDGRVTKLEELCKEMNTNITSLQTIVNVLQSNDYITGVVEVTKNGEVIGYTITFGKHDPITIYHGQDGKDGADGKDGQDGSSSTPVIGVAQDTDGVYYWTLNGEWLLDDNGNKLPVSGTNGKDGQNGSNGQDGTDGKDGQDGTDGKDGVTPQLKIEDGYWYISYDNGATWTQLGKATGEDGKDGQNGSNGTNGKDGKDGDSMFQSVTQDDNYVYFTLADGTVIKIAKGTSSDNQPNSKDIIVFRDLAVKSALLKLDIDTTRDNEISYGEAAAYAGDISMKTNTNIYSFNEFQYFTNVTSCNFSDCTNLFEIVLPSCLSSISESSFSNCSSITSIVIPNSVQSIEESAFSECTSLKSVSIPNSVTYIGRSAFYKCPLESFTFNEKYNGDAFIFGYCASTTPTESIKLPTIIYWNTTDYQKDFYNRSYIYDRAVEKYGLGGAELYYSYSTSKSTPINLKNVIFGDEVKTIPNYICAYLQELTEIAIPDNVTTIGKYAFYNCTSANSITFGNNVNSIGEYAFSGCESITSIEIPNSVKTIDQYAFYLSTELTSVTLGSAITDIGDYTFYSCTKLQKLYCKATTPPLLGTSVIPTTIGIIYVPRTSVDEYKALWSDYANKIVGYDFE